MAVMSNQQAVIDEDAFAVRRTIDIAAPVDKVWTAVTAPEHISQWFGQAAFDGSGAGSVGTITWPGEHSVPVRIEAVEEPRSISYRWRNDQSGNGSTDVDSGPSTVFTFTLDAVPGGTRLTVVETGFEALADPAGTMESHREGWDGELDKLVALVRAG